MSKIEELKQLMSIEGCNTAPDIKRHFDHIAKLLFECFVIVHCISWNIQRWGLNKPNNNDRTEYWIIHTRRAFGLRLEWMEMLTQLWTDGAARAEAKLVWIMPKYRANESRVKLAWLCRVQPIFNEVNRDRGRRSQLCGKCHVLKGQGEEILYTDYIDGKRSYMDITLEIRSNRWVYDNRYNQHVLTP